MRHWSLVVILVVAERNVVMACGRSRGSRRGYSCPRRDTTPPTVTCPQNRVEFADPFQVNTKVYWDESTVVANDNRDGNIRWTRIGRAPGRIFSEGRTKIRYSARDKSGNYASCQFTVTVKVKTCEKWGLIQDGWKICHVSHDSSHVRLGSVCRFGCYGGHELVGPTRSTCLITESWDIPTQPFCQKLQCPALMKSSEQFDVVDIACTDGNYYRSMCSYNCIPGYSVLPGNSKVQICTEFGSWLGDVPQCVDTEPPTYVTCPYGVTTYAERTKQSGRAWWNKPKAQDNSGHVTTIQISGPASGTDLDVGEYAVTYMSYDAENNSAECAFNVVVKQIKCHTIYPLPYTSVMCPTGRIFGSYCEFLCDNGTVINGNKVAECTKEGSTVPYGVWTFDNYQPYCEQQNTCPVLQPPDNGALVCDTWKSGRFCQMLCQEKHVVIDDPTTINDEVAIHKSLLVCGDSGTWYRSDDIPGCQKVSDRFWMVMKLSLDFLYYTGECTKSMDEIKLKFIEAIKGGLSEEWCSPDSCNVNNVKVICGALSKRDTSIRKREVSEGLSMELTVELPSDIDGTDALQAKTNVTNSISSAIDNGDLDIEVDGEQISPTIGVSEPQGGCSDGSAFDKQSLMCVACSAGYYYASTYDTCLRCPVGYYQDEDKQTSCKVCPIGKTTVGKGASSEQHCYDACTAGYYSNTGIEPCTVCDLGTYSTTYGSMYCTPCPGSQITLKSASTSITECQEFDITYTMLNSTESSIPALLPVQDVNANIIIELWVKCSQCDTILDIVDTDGTQILDIEDTDQMRLIWHGNLYETQMSVVGSDTWKRITVTTNAGVIAAYIDSVEVLNEVYTYQPNVSTVNITVGGDGFVGSISQVNIWSTSLESPPLSADSCFVAEPGDLVAWNQFSELDGTFTLTKSKCDAVDNCLDSPCKNGGLCADGIDVFSCACIEGFTGSTCDINIDDCLQNVCDNGGICVDGVGHYTCQCPDGFTGELCEIKYVDGGWTEWVTSGGCSVSCGTGVQNRSRVCENPEPSNGGEQCNGDATEIVECETNTTCVLDCLTDPPDIVNGNTNCTWTDENNDTRECHPSCDEGYAFDTDLFVYTSGIACGPDTGYSWNINTTDNPMLQLPSCTTKTEAIANKLNYTMEYTTLHVLTLETAEVIQQTVDGSLNQTGCVGTGQCKLQTVVYLSDSASSNMTGVLLTLQLSCDVQNDMDECYNVLADLVQALEIMITQLQFTVQYDGMGHDVGVNTSSLDGITTCRSGHVPVWHYCVPCGKGTYAYNNYCEVCPVGTYQDVEGQVSCKQCADEWTTAGYMSRDRSVCNVYAPSTDEDITNASLIGLTAGLSVAALIAIFAAVGIVCKKQSRPSSVGHSLQDLSVHTPNAGGMHNGNKKFNPFIGHATHTRDGTDIIDLDQYPSEQSRSFSPPPCYDNYVGEDIDIDVVTRPSTAVSFDQVTTIGKNSL